MKIDKITSQHRRDFTAVLVCEHCGAFEDLETGYDDHFYHANVIPSMVCKTCGKAAPEDHRPLAPKYAEGAVI